jgi:uncharacterized protein
LFDVGTMVAAFLVLRVLHPRDSYGLQFERLLHWQVGVGWYVVALFGYVAIWLAAAVLSGDVNTESDEPGSMLRFAPSYLTYLLQAVPEEVAWQGFALSRLQARRTALISSLVIGLLGTL